MTGSLLGTGKVVRCQVANVLHPAIPQAVAAKSSFCVKDVLGYSKLGKVVSFFLGGGDKKKECSSINI
jgi:hypothetical protein